MTKADARIFSNEAQVQESERANSCIIASIFHNSRVKKKKKNNKIIIACAREGKNKDSRIMLVCEWVVKLM